MAFASDINLECRLCNDTKDASKTSCLYCDSWAHITCIGLTEIYGTKALENPYVHYICAFCTPVIKNLIKLDHIKDVFNPTPKSSPTPNPTFTTFSASAADSVSSPILNTKTTSKLNSQTLPSLPLPLFSRSTPHSSYVTPPYVSPIFNKAYKTQPVNVKNKFDALDSDLDLNKSVPHYSNTGTIDKNKNRAVQTNGANKNTYRNTNKKVNRVGTYVIGDSISRNLAENLGKITGKSCLGEPQPGGGVEKVIKKIRSSKTEHDTLVVQVGTNDIGILKESDIKFKFRALLEDMKNRRQGAVLVGILPRAWYNHDYEDFTNKEALYINKWLVNECRIRNIKFLDLWDRFHGDWSLYGADGLHLSKNGKNVLAQKVANIINENFLDQ